MHQMQTKAEIHEVRVHILYDASLHEVDLRKAVEIVPTSMSESQRHLQTFAVGNTYLTVTTTTGCNISY